MKQFPEMLDEDGPGSLAVEAITCRRGVAQQTENTMITFSTE